MGLGNFARPGRLAQIDDIVSDISVQRDLIQDSNRIDPSLVNEKDMISLKLIPISLISEANFQKSLEYRTLILKSIQTFTQ